jgi:hypothetical protein
MGFADIGRRRLGFPRSAAWRRSRGAPRGAVGALLALVVSAASGCATVTGLATGVVTGAVDAPAEVYRHHREEFHAQPLYWSLNVLVGASVGLVLGPLAGGAKGLALDMERLIGRTTYGPVFASYDEASIWRPYTFRW